MQPFVLRSYIGISEEPTWRWARCEHHSNMRPHYLDYDRMFVLTACYGSNCCGMERLLQQKLLNHAPSKCAFSDVYRKGPIHDGRVYFLYCCVNLRKRRLEWPHLQGQFLLSCFCFFCYYFASLGCKQSMYLWGIDSHLWINTPYCRITDNYSLAIAANVMI